MIIYSATALGAAIRRARKAKKLSQTEVGNTFNIEQSTISSIEQGAPGTRLKTLLRVLAALELELVVRPKQSAPNPSKEDW